MNLTATKQDLARELSLAMGAVHDKSTIPILGNVLLEARDGKIDITTTDLELSIRTSIEATIATPGVITIPAKRLSSFVSALPDGEVTLKVGANGHVNVSGNGTRARIPGMDQAAFPTLPVVPPPIAEMRASLLSRMFACTIHSISDAASRFSLPGALLRLTPGEALAASTDGVGLSVYKAELGWPSHDYCIVPKRAMEEFAALASSSPAGSPVAVAMDDNHIFLTVGKRSITARKVTGNFPDYARVIPHSFPASCIVSRSDMRSAIARVSQFTDDKKTKAGNFEAGPDGMRIWSETTDGGCDSTIPLDSREGTLKTTMNMLCVDQFLAACKTDKVRIQFGHARGVVQFEPVGSESGWIYLIQAMWR
jgi:DNA polymerase-3 subunit beta